MTTHKFIIQLIMKTFLLNLKTLALVTLTLGAITFTSCNDDDNVKKPIKDDLVGTWDITSYKVDGDEYMGLAIEAGSITFHAYTGAKGVFDQAVTFPDEESTSISGDYTADDETSKIEMNYEGEIIVAEITITGDGDKLRWDGTKDGYPLVILATRR